MKKKILISIAFLLFTVISFAQFDKIPYSTPNRYDQNRGMIGGKLGFQLPVVDTLNNPAQPYFGALTVRPQDTTNNPAPPIYMSIVSKWVAYGSAINRNDTLFAALPAYFDYTTRPGSTILRILHADGLIDGGIVTKSNCWEITVTSATVVLNFKTYISATTVLAIDTADATFGRVDRVVIDTFGIVSVITGTPSVTPTAPPYDFGSQFPITTIFIPAAAVCLPSMLTLIYDENVEWATGNTGTMTVDFNSVANPFRNAKSAFVPVYNNGSALTFTHGSNDTAQLGEVLFAYIYVNGYFSNQFQFQLYNGSTPVGNPVSFNSGFGFNPADSNEYQLVAIPFTSFNLTNQVFNKLVITMAGNDLSGAKGFYIDYINLQTGISNFSFGKGVIDFAKNAAGDSIILTREDGIKFPVFDRGGGAAADRFGIEDNTGVQDRTNDMQGKTFDITNAGYFDVTSGVGTNPHGELFIDSTQTNIYSLGTPGQNNHIAITHDSLLLYSAQTGANTQLVLKPTTATIALNNGVPQYIPLDVNGNFADATGHIAIPIGGSGTVTNIATGYGLSGGPITTTGTIIVDSAALSLKYLRIVDTANIRFRPVAGSNITLTGTYPNITIAASAPGTGTVTSVGLTSTDLTIGGTTSPITTSGTFTLTLPTVNSNVGTWNNVTINAKGLATAGSNVAYLTTADTTNIANFSVKVRSLFSATAPITYVNGLIGLGTVPIANGGTNITTYTTGDLIYASATNVLSKLAIGTSAQHLVVSGGLPVWRDTTAVSAGSTLTRQVITSGTTATVTGGNYVVNIDPASTMATFTLTMPASPSDLQTVEVAFGGTLTSGMVVTALTISPNSGQTVQDNTPPGSATADNTLYYRYRTSNTTWRRIKF